jgi:Tol biopolymer transport system component
VIEEQIYEQRLITLDVNSRRVRFISPPDLYVYEYDWSPDGKSFAVIAAHGAGDNNWWIARLYTIAAPSGATKPVAKPAFQIARPRWSPDGKLIAVIGGLMSDAIVPAGDIFVVPAAGGELRNITPGMKSSAASLAWLPASRRLLFTSHADGGSSIATADPESDKVVSLWTGPETIEAEDEAFTWSPALSLSRDGQKVAVIRHSFQQPPRKYGSGPSAIGNK